MIIMIIKLPAVTLTCCALYMYQLKNPSIVYGVQGILKIYTQLLENKLIIKLDSLRILHSMCKSIGLFLLCTVIYQISVPQWREKTVFYYLKMYNK